MKITPKAESEISSGFECLPNGEYPFTVMESDVKVSKSEKNKGREMCAVKLVVHGPQFDKHVYDYFADWFSEWKLKHFCEVTNMAADYASGEIDPSGGAWIERQGFVKIKRVPATGNYDEKNEVVDYLPQENQTVEALSAPKKTIAPAKKTVQESPVEDDSIPF